MSSSIDGSSSTNDVSSTHRSSNTSFHQETNRPNANVLTQDKIIKECIRQGFYRTPLCNEKLFLHNKGFDSIAQTAFDLYTDVKVLWLEGNGLSQLNVGGNFIQTAPPRQKFSFAEEDEEEKEEESASASEEEETPQVTQKHVDPLQGLEETEEGAGEEEPHHVVLPLIEEVDVADKDCFSSLYPTVRQLYLHNNVFREMPDLSRFHQLDSLHLGGNFFSRVESYCPYWEKERTSYRNQLEKDNVMRVQLPEQETTSTEVAVVKEVDPEEREKQLDGLRIRVETLNQLCHHTPLSVGDDGALPKKIPKHQRHPCSTLRSLNLSNNRLETFEDCASLLCYKSLTTLDLSQNNITDGEALLLILERLPKLKSLKLTGNPLVRTVRRYRQTVLSRCKSLLHLDDRPVFDDERRLVTAWTREGDEGTAKERELIKQENIAKQEKRLSDFRSLLAAHRNEPAAQGYIQTVSSPTALDSVPAAGGNIHSRFNNRERVSSSTSSETDEDEGEVVAAEVDLEANENKPTVAEEKTRVLSSNGSPSTKETKEAGEDADDIYIPGSS